MQPGNWRRDHRRWLELFVLANFGGLVVDIYLAHSVNQFHHWAEYVPLYFSLAAPIVLLVALAADLASPRGVIWYDLGQLIGWVAVGIGLVGVVLHLDSHYFYERTIQSLVYAAPFAAPLAYTGLGLLLIMNRLVDEASEEWPRWVLLLALGGFFGNFVFSLTDHAQNGFYHATEWIPVVSSALVVGFLTAPFLTPVGRAYLRLCAAILVLQLVVGVVGFYLHNAANLAGPSPDAVENFIHGAPPMAPLLFPNLVLLAGIGLWVLAPFLPAEAPAPEPVPAP
jgi:hypothetical protein